MRFEPLEIFDAEQGVVCFYRMTAVGRTSGLEVDRELTGVYEVRDGKIAREWVYHNREEALRAAGARRR